MKNFMIKGRETKILWIDNFMSKMLEKDYLFFEKNAISSEN